MHFHKPVWLSHAGEKKDHEVYSCHVSPDGSRLATAGGDGHVRIWSTAAILHTQDASHGKARQLASLSYHSGTVHSVRFSANGKYLASGADDKIVCVYRLEEGAPTHVGFGSGEEAPVENWRIFRRLIGHDNDVQDVGWSNDSSILVSVGLDSKVVVWSGSTFERLKTLAQHQSHVKGLTFDPANKYFATASDDRSIKIYRFTSPPPNATAHDQTSNFTLEHSVTGPFATSPLTTYFRRPSWSPEGAHIAAANAVNGPVSSVAIIERGAWSGHINLIGHEGPIEVCAFSPRLFSPRPPPPVGNEGRDYVPQPTVTIIACAGQDRTLSVWNTSFPRPFATTAELAAKSISDLAWSPDGETVYVTALDGTIAAIVFERGELGYPAPPVDNDKALAKYGAGRRVGIVENTDALRLEAGSKKDELRGVEGRMGELMGDGVTDTSTAVAAAAVNGGDIHMPDATAGLTNGTTNNVASKETTPAPAPAPKDPQAEKADKLKQRVTITKDGKKRIAPLLVSSSNQGETNLPRPQLQAAVRQAGGASDEPAHILDLSKPYDGLPKGGLAALLAGNKRKFAELEGEAGEEKRTEKRVQAIQQTTGTTPVLINGVDGLAVPSAAGKKDGAGKEKEEPPPVPEVLRPAIINPSLTVSQVRLAVPMVRTVILRPLDPSKPAEPDGGGMNLDNDNNNNSTETDAKNPSNLVFEARNASSASGIPGTRHPTRITLSRRSQILWQDFLPRAALLVTGNRNFWAVGCEDGSVHLWTPAGRRLCNACVLEAQPVILECRGWWVLIVTAVGQCYVWDVRTMSSPHPPVSLAPVLDIAAQSLQVEKGLTHAPASVQFARLNSEGKIILGLSNGDGFAYNPALFVWQKLSELWWAVGSQYWNTLSPSPSSSSTTTTSSDPHVALSAGIIPYLERATTSASITARGGAGRAFHLQKLVKALLSAEGFEGFETSVSIAHLENRLAASLTLGAREEFRVYLVMYAKRIGAEGARGKVEELLRGLLGPGGFEQEEEGEGSAQFGVGLEAILGWKREDLLREVVMVLGRQRDLQRLVVPYARLLGVVEASAGEGPGLIMEG